MKGRMISCRENELSLLKYALIIPILIVAGCAYRPNLLPTGAPEILTYPGVRVISGAVDYPIVVTTAKDQKKVKISWVYKGELIWGEWPGRTASKVQFSLSQPGRKDQPPLCQSGWMDQNQTDFDCEFAVGDYTSEPLVGELSFLLGGEPMADDAPLPRAVSRTFYLLEHPKPSK